MLPTTKLEAVNIMLASIGEAPINSLDSGLVDAEMAETILDAVTRSVQSEGWTFNTEYSMKLTPDVDEHIIIPVNTLKIDPVNRSVRLVRRGGKLYDPLNHTFKFKQPVIADIVVALAFEDLPETARRYSAIKAARTFQDRTVGSTQLHGFQSQDEQMAYMKMVRDESQVSDHNFLSDNQSQSITNRRATGSILSGGRIVIT
ncbi:hypothetical protein [Nitrincola sp. A-D6]|uniref:hypothetical protein n=1 Tax=Nitrincola sp. A-D6 TaxID=1545442 RepID=UPI000689A115|nr:hypothetical protein [Nitrincola sp. A-D6]